MARIVENLNYLPERLTDMTTTYDSSNGVINPDELYTLRAFKKRLGVSDATLRSARRNGLRVTYIHKQGFIHGRDWIEYVLASSQSTVSSPAPVTE